MITPPGIDGVAFSDRADGDMRGDLAARSRLSQALEISSEWATLTQVHGSVVLEVTESGDAGRADGLWTKTVGLPLAVFTADCLGVVLHSEGAVGVAHAGWRGVDSGVVTRLREQMGAAARSPISAWVGPGIGPCCFEVGPEVSGRFTDSVATTTWGTHSVDLVAALGEQLDGLEVRVTGGCTMHEEGWFSHRKDGTPARLATLGWLR